MPRPPPAPVKSLPARVAGGYPRDEVDGVGPVVPLLAPLIITTTRAKTTVARMGITTRRPQPRKLRPARNSLDQRRWIGSGSSERSRLAHSPSASRGGPASARLWGARARAARLRAARL